MLKRGVVYFDQQTVQLIFYIHTNDGLLVGFVTIRFKDYPATVQNSQPTKTGWPAHFFLFSSLFMHHFSLILIQNEKNKDKKHGKNA